MSWLNCSATKVSDLSPLKDLNLTYLGLAETKVSDLSFLNWIPPGTFLMGSSRDEKERRADEIQHEVTLTKGLYMAALST